MELKAKFDVTYMEEALVFLESLPDKVKDKIAYNISKSRYFMDKELFTKLNDNIWEFRTYIKALSTVYWHSGIKIQAIL
jgi:hypothetical protein